MDYFNLYANCVPVTGITEGIILDLQRKEYLAVPNLLIEILSHSKTKTVTEIKSLYNKEYNDGIDKYLGYFVENGLGFYLDNPENFPALSLSWEIPNQLYNAIVEITEESDFDYIDAINQLNDLGCNSLQVRITHTQAQHIIEQVTGAGKLSRFKMIEVYLPEQCFDIAYTRFFDLEDSRLIRIVVYDTNLKSECFNSEKYGRYFIHHQLVFTDKKLDAKTTDRISIENFVINVDFFTEAQQHNVSLNRKVAIDYSGGLKNDLSHRNVFGNIKTTKIVTLLENKDFLKKWHVSNNEIKKCKDCQFRYICLDGSDLIYSHQYWQKTNDCGFNPIANRWIS